MDSLHAVAVLITSPGGCIPPLVRDPKKPIPQILETTRWQK